MKVSTKGRLAITALVDLASCKGDAPVNLQDISDRRSISKSYLEQLFSMLRRHKIVTSVRGPGGGYALADCGLEISLAEIVMAVDGSPAASKPRVKRSRRKGQPRCVDDLWGDLTDMVFAHLSGVTRAHLVAKPSLVEPPVAHVLSRIRSHA